MCVYMNVRKCVCEREREEQKEERGRERREIIHFLSLNCEKKSNEKHFRKISKDSQT